MIQFGMLVTYLMLSISGVANASNTFGCHPTKEDVATFTTVVYSSMTNNSCFKCHGNAASSTSKLAFHNDAAMTFAQQKKNLCLAYRYGQEGSYSLVLVPMMSRLHQNIAGRYTMNQLGPIFNWITDYKLP